MDEMNEIQVELNLALDLNNQQQPQNNNHDELHPTKSKSIGSVSQYSNAPKESSLDSDRGSGCTNKYSGNTAISDVLSDSVDSFTEEGDKGSSYISSSMAEQSGQAVLKPLLDGEDTEMSEDQTE